MLRILQFLAQLVSFLLFISALPSKVEKKTKKTLRLLCIFFKKVSRKAGLKLIETTHWVLTQYSRIPNKPWVLLWLFLSGFFCVFFFNAIKEPFKSSFLSLNIKTSEWVFFWLGLCLVLTFPFLEKESMKKAWLVMLVLVALVLIVLNPLAVFTTIIMLMIVLGAPFFFIWMLILFSPELSRVVKDYLLR